jgi:hypothetical protein
MASIFSKEINDENQRLEDFRRYASIHIPEASQRHDSRRFRRISFDETSKGVSRPRFALGNEMKLSLDQEETGAIEVMSVLEAEHGSVEAVRPISSPRSQSRLSMSRIILFILVALFTGSSMVALSWLNRPLPSTFWLEDIQGWRSQFKLSQGDTVYQGSAPVVLDQLASGSYSLKITLPGGDEFSREIELSSGQELRLNVSEMNEVERGVVYLSSRPLGAQVFVRNNRVGKTPLELVLPKQYVRIRVGAEGYQDSTIKLKPRSDLALTHHLELAPLKVRWSIRLGVPKGRVQLKTGSSDKSWRLLGVGDQSIDLSNRVTHRIRVIAQGYETQELDLKPVLRDVAEKVVILKPKHQRAALADSVLTFTEQAQTYRPARNGPPSREKAKAQSKKVKRRVRRRRRKSRESRSRSRSTKSRKRIKTSAQGVKSAQAPKPTSSQAQPGFLKLIVLPPAKVSIDGKSVGWTPLLNYKLSEGVHKIKLRFASGEEKVISQSISAGRVSLRRIRK